MLDCSDLGTDQIWVLFRFGFGVTITVGHETNDAVMCLLQETITFESRGLTALSAPDRTVLVGTQLRE